MKWVGAACRSSDPRMEMGNIRGLAGDGRFRLIVLSSVLALGGVGLVSPALPSLAEGLAVGDGTVGLLITAYTLPAIVIMPLAGWLSDTIGSHRVMASGSFLIGVGGVASFWVGGFWELIGLRIVQGIGYAALMPLTVSMIGDLFEGNRETAAQGLRGASNKVGDLVWMVLAGVIVGYGWRNLFLLYAVFLPFAVVLYLRLPAGGETEEGPMEYVRSIVSVAREPRMGMYLSIGFVRMFVRYSLLAFLPLLFTERFGASSAEVGLVLGMMSFIGVLTSVAAGGMDARFRKTTSVFLALAAIGLACLVVAASWNPWIAVAAVLVVGLADAGLSPLHKSLLTRNVDQGHRSGVIAANSTIQSLGKTVGPAVMGLAVVYGLDVLFGAVGGLALLGSVTMFRARSLLQRRGLHP